MRQDLNEKYRPKKFSDFWNQDNTICTVTKMLKAKALPKSLLFWGDYGTGKTSIARVTARAISCLGEEQHEPCGKCDGCLYYTERIMGQIGAALLLQGNQYNPDKLRRFVFEATHYVPPERFNAYVVVLDELQRLSEKEQESLLHTIEDTARTHFVFCTTDVNGICDGIRARTHEMPMNTPTKEQTIAALSRIAREESIDASEAQISEIARTNHNVPRNCLKALQKALG